MIGVSGWRLAALELPLLPAERFDDASPYRLFVFFLLFFIAAASIAFEPTEEVVHLYGRSCAAQRLGRLLPYRDTIIVEQFSEPLDDPWATYLC